MEQKNNTANQPELQRTFTIGDEWLYYKFYTGPKTADIILTQMLKPLTEQLLAGGVIDKWFFIRYADPKTHTRVRFHVTGPQALLQVIQAVNQLSKPYIEQSLIWKIQVDSYQREVERYGIKSMDLGETFFFYDSKMIVDMLNHIEGDEGERIRWMFGLRAVDALLGDFGYSMEEKLSLISIMRESYGREHGMNRGLRSQLEKKFRKDRKEINGLMDRNNDNESVMLPLFRLIDRRSEEMKPVAAEILKLYDNKNPDPFLLNDLLFSYSHMLTNRLFKSKQRTHEMVLYDFMARYYTSEISKQKYAKINAEKKKQKELAKQKKKD
ncbi:MAG: hypothetical protein GY757_60315 [bacterium]|nr:hypothetical protein [bacterium]